MLHLVWPDFYKNMGCSIHVSPDYRGGIAVEDPNRQDVELLFSKDNHQEKRGNPQKSAESRYSIGCEFEYR